MQLMYYIVLLILTTFSPSPIIEARKSTIKLPRRKHRTRIKRAKAEVDYVLSIERAVEQAEFQRLPEEEMIPKDPKLWLARAAWERAQLERDKWHSEHLPPNPGARPARRSAPRYPSNLNVTKSKAARLSKRLFEALDEEAIDPTLYDNYDEELKLVRELKDRVGEKVLNSWRRRTRSRPPANTLQYSLQPLQRLELPVMMTGAMRSLLRRNERKLRQMSLELPDTTPRWQPAAKPHAAPPSQARRNFEFDKWLNKFKYDTPALQPLHYTIWPMVYESWITKLWYYSTPTPTRMKLWAFRKMQESIYHVQGRMLALDDVIKRNANNVKFNICYTMTVFDTLLRDLRLFWTFLRHRFYLSTITKYVRKRTIFSDVWKTIEWILGKGIYKYLGPKASLNVIPMGHGIKTLLGRDRSGDISRHLIYYTMATRRYVDLMGMSEQIMFAYHNRDVKKKEEKAKRIASRLARAMTGQGFTGEMNMSRLNISGN